MKQTKLTLLNTSILTEYGTYLFEPLTLDEARSLVRAYQMSGREIQSAIGHQSTADMLTALLEFPVPANRMTFVQTPDDAALVLKLKRRPPEGTVLSRAEIEEIGYEFGLLTRKA